jgi:uncharacterized protein YciI
MKHFLIEITYTADLERIIAVRPEHRAYVQGGFDRGLLLLAGPLTSMTGAVIVGRAESREEIERFFADDPYRLKSLATYRIVEYQPALLQPFLNAWMEA